ncbi:MAG: PDZ domain-containing protein [Vulcanimicrobiota bacterium]
MPKIVSPKKLNDLKNSVVRIILAVIIIGVPLFTIQTPYMYEAPANCTDASTLVNVSNSGRESLRDRFFVATVSYYRANLFLFLKGLLLPQAELTPIPDTNIKIYISEKKRKQNEQNKMEESQLFAHIAALRAMGYNIEFEKSPVIVTQVFSWGDARNKLEVGDKILEIDRRKVENNSDLFLGPSKYRIGNSVTLKIDRNGKILEKNVKLTLVEERLLIGISAGSKLKGFKSPFRIDYNVDNIQGTSAGLMFALEIIKQISGVDMTGGKKIAGTGVIYEDGDVYPIEGVKHKIKAAEAKNMDYFLVPSENYKEAKKTATRLQVIPVDNLNGALKAIKKINPSVNLDFSHPSALKEEN